MQTQRHYLLAMLIANGHISKIHFMLYLAFMSLTKMSKVLFDNHTLQVEKFECTQV